MSDPRDVQRSWAAPRERSDLCKQYRAIGIGAVAAALTLTSEQKNETYAPAAPKVVNFHDFDRLAARVSVASGR